MRLLFLFADVFSYNFAILNILQNYYEHEIHLIHWGNNSGSENHMKYYNPSYNIYKKPNNYNDLKGLINKINPNIIVIAGWMDLFYLRIAFKYRKIGCKVICAMDTQYDNNIKQRIASIILKNNHFRRLFYSNVWIPGFPQFETAIRFGFKSNEIIYGLLSADSNIFKKIHQFKNRNKTFLFVGRLEKEKGIEILFESWKIISNKYPDWKLNIVGNGSFTEKLNKLNNVFIKGFLNPEEVALEMNHADCFLLPSYYEPWGLVLHEAVLCGLPIICTQKCGSRSFFVIDNLNGFVIKEKDQNALTYAMIKFIQLKDNKFNEFSKFSLILGSQISSNISAAQLNANI